MSKFNKYISTFKQGEVSPLTFGRTSDEGYMERSKKMYNCLPLKNGGFTKRAGTMLGADLGDMAAPALIEFIGTDNVGYVIAIDVTEADDFIRVYEADGVEAAITDLYSAALGAPAIDPEIDATLDPKGFVSAQVGDIMWVTHTSGNFMPMIIQREGVSAFSCFCYLLDSPYNRASYLGDSAVIGRTMKSPYRDRNVRDLTITPSGTTGNITLTASSALFYTGMEDVTYFKIIHGSTEGIARITQVTNSTSANATVVIAFGATTASARWAESAWSFYRGFPRTVTAFQNRLIWGGNEAQPDTIWGSFQGNYWLMDAERLLQDQGATSDISTREYFGDATDADPFIFTIASNTPASINWMAPSSTLKIGTITKEYVASGSDESLGVSSVSITPQTSHGSKAGKIVQVDDEIMFIDASGRRLRNLRYSENNGSNVSENLSLMAEHMSQYGRGASTVPGLASLAFQNDEKIVWMINSSNKLISLTLQRDSDVQAWAKHEVEGAVEISCLAVIPAPEKDSTRLWMAVKRTINNATVWYLEYKVKEFDGDSLDSGAGTVDEDLPVYLDSAKVVTFGAPSDTVTGLDHLEGEEVAVLADGTYIGDFTVASGDVVLDETYGTGTVFIVGLYYEAEQVSVGIEAGGDWGSSQGMTSRIDRATIKFHKSLSVEVGDEEQTFAVNFESDDDVQTEEYRVDLPNDPEFAPVVRIKSTGPYPMTVLGMALRGVAND